jgi:hypothetical protein
MVSFDPYLNWLGIPPHDQPPNFYRLLGIVLFESNREVIEQAADRQSLRVGQYQSGPQGELCQQLLNEIAMATFCLLDPEQKAAYDGQLNEIMAHRGERASISPPPPASMNGSQQFGPPSPQFGQQPEMQPGMGPSDQGNGMPAYMTIPAPPPPQFGEQPGMQPSMGPSDAGSGVPGSMPMAAPPPPQFGQQPGVQPGMQPSMGPSDPGNGMPGPMIMSAPPPPQFGQQPGMQPGMGPVDSGSGMPGPMTMPGPPPTMQAPMPGMAAMPGPPAMPHSQQPFARLPIPGAVMPGPAGFTPAMSRSQASAAMPVAAPFRAPTAAAISAGPVAPPVSPPAVAQRPLDELESLASQPTIKRRFLKKKAKPQDNTSLIIGGVVAAVGFVLFIGYLVIMSQGKSKSGYDVVAQPEKPKISTRARLAEERKQKEKEIERKERERENKPAADHAPASGGNAGPLRPFSDGGGRSNRSGDGDTPLSTPHNFGPPTRAMDSPDPGGPIQSGPQPLQPGPHPDGRDTPRDLGGPSDPVMETPKE